MSLGVRETSPFLSSREQTIWISPLYRACIQAVLYLLISKPRILANWMHMVKYGFIVNINILYKKLKSFIKHELFKTRAKFMILFFFFFLIVAQ